MNQQARIAKQIMDLQRVAFDGMLNNMIVYWDETEKLLGAMLDKAAWVPDEGKKAFREWMDGNKKGCETLKKAVNDGFNNIEGCLARSNGTSSE